MLPEWQASIITDGQNISFRKEQQSGREENWRSGERQKTLSHALYRIVNPSVLGKDQERAQYRDAEGLYGKRSKKGRDERYCYGALCGGFIYSQCLCDQCLSIIHYQVYCEVRALYR